MKPTFLSTLVWGLVSVLSIVVLIVLLFLSVPQNPNPFIIMNRFGIFFIYCLSMYVVYQLTSSVYKLSTEPQYLEDGCIYIYQGKSHTGKFFLTEVAKVDMNYNEDIIGGMEYSATESFEDGVYIVPEDILKQELILNKKYVYKNNVLVEMNEA